MEFFTPPLFFDIVAEKHYLCFGYVICAMKVTTFVNEPLDSNCYVLEESSRAIVVDPGCSNVHSLTEYLAHNSLKLDYIILTHEHIDHVQSTKSVAELYDAPVIATAECIDALHNPQLNLSADYPDVEPQSYLPPRTTTIESLGNNIVWGNIGICFYATPGHSAGSMCFTVSDILFSGDTLLEKIKTYTTAPNSSIVELRDSFELIKSSFSPTQIVYPGHGTPFTLKDVEPFIDAQIRLLERKIARKGIHK